jgi:hypothetical protein
LSAPHQQREQRGGEGLKDLWIGLQRQPLPIQNFGILAVGFQPQWGTCREGTTQSSPHQDTATAFVRQMNVDLVPVGCTQNWRPAEDVQRVVLSLTETLPDG